MAYLCKKNSDCECFACGECMESVPICERCGEEIDGETYEDIDYDCLCLDCLEQLHKRDEN